MLSFIHILPLQYLKIHIELDFEDIEFYTKLDFVEIEIQNRGILLNTLEREVFCYIVLKLRIFTHFVCIGM